MAGPYTQFRVVPSFWSNKFLVQWRSDYMALFWHTASKHEKLSDASEALRKLKSAQ